MTETAKRGPGRPKATTPEPDAGTDGSQTVAVYNTDTDTLVTPQPVPVAVRKLVQMPHGTLVWRHPEANAPLGSVALAWGLDDGTVIWQNPEDAE